MLKLEAVRTLVALGWVAAGFLYELGVTLAWPEVRLLTRLGGGELRANRPPGKLGLTLHPHMSFPASANATALA